MSPRAAWRLESLGFREVYDYVDGKADWLAAGLQIEGKLAEQRLIGQLATKDVPSCGLKERIGDVATRAKAAGWDQAIVVNDQRIVLGVLTEEVLMPEQNLPAEACMHEGPVTWRPNTQPQEAARWMDDNQTDSIVVTSSDGRLIGVLRSQDLEV